MFYFKVYYINISSAFIEIWTLTTVLDLVSLSKEQTPQIIARSLSLTHKHGNTQQYILLFIAFQQKHAFYIEFKNCKWLQWRVAANLYKWLILRNFWKRKHSLGAL